MNILNLPDYTVTDVREDGGEYRCRIAYTPSR